MSQTAVYDRKNETKDEAKKGRERRKPFTFTILPGVVEDIKKLAERDDRSCSRKIETILKKYLKENS